MRGIAGSCVQPSARPPRDEDKISSGQPSKRGSGAAHRPSSSKRSVDPHADLLGGDSPPDPLSGQVATLEPPKLFRRMLLDAGRIDPCVPRLQALESGHADTL